MVQLTFPNALNIIFIAGHQNSRLTSVNGAYYVLPALSQPAFLSDPSEMLETLKIFSHVFVACYDLLVIHTESTILAFMACDNKADTLTQGQMLKTADAADFILSQCSEIAGLEKMGVFSYHHISHLPPRAKLLHSICSYQRKRRLLGDVCACGHLVNPPPDSTAYLNYATKILPGRLYPGICQAELTDPVRFNPAFQSKTQ
jgi:hypothetical protein